MLAKLPRELLDHVSSFLPTPAFNNLRLACKLVENKIFPYWSNAFFKRKQFMITAFSLQTLVDISRHATLGPCMTHLIIGLDYFRSVGQQYANTRDDYQQFQDACDAQELLLDTGAALQLLTTALLNLPNLESIDVRNFNSPTRYRDIYKYRSNFRVCPAWKSYGYSEIPDWSPYLALQNGSLFGNNGDIGPSHFVNRVVRVLLTAIGQSESPLRGLEVIIRPFHHFRTVALTGGGLGVLPILGKGIPTKLPLVLSRLTKLHLDVNLGSDSLPSVGSYQYPFKIPSDMPKSAEEVSDPSSTNLRKLLALTSNLTWLRLNNRSNTWHGSVRLMSWLALNPETPFGVNIEARWGDSNPKPVSFPLRRLDLGNMRLHTSTLDLLVIKFDKLECLSFRDVHLQPVQAQLDEMEDDRENRSVWAAFFQKLPKAARNLKQLSLKGISESLEPQSIHKHPVVFYPAITEDDHVETYNLDLSTIDQAALEALAANTWIRKVWLETRHRDYYPDSDNVSIEHGDDGSVDTEHPDGSDEDEDHDEDDVSG
ncbi:hypothetical protein N0V93_006482 [Gnomoniopsis smithogilvyi]|uniref:F-box domain-containing protein n=1 Tax=Gnomoniopsis smithogilvyi TaxID=1191159 RepID=A0A9W8YNQ0_9PEZI|nr:hypothetical protein N0V93_006482 [Gnomoniopsis smithogilvyi]